MNQEKATSLAFELKPQRPFETIAVQLQEGRRSMAFDFCFQLNYPNCQEETLRSCIYEYSSFTKVS